MPLAFLKWIPLRLWCGENQSRSVVARTWPRWKCAVL